MRASRNSMRPGRRRHAPDRRGHRRARLLGCGESRTPPRPCPSNSAAPECPRRPKSGGCERRRQSLLRRRDGPTAKSRAGSAGFQPARRVPGATPGTRRQGIDTYVSLCRGARCLEDTTALIIGPSIVVGARSSARRAPSRGGDAAPTGHALGRSCDQDRPDDRSGSPSVQPINPVRHSTSSARTGFAVTSAS